MISENMAEAINTQIKNEIYSGYLYMSMSAYAAYTGYKGAANWFMVQYQEEMSHAMKLYNYLESQAAQVKLQAIDRPPAEFKSLLDMFEQTLKHEKTVTAMINGLVDLAKQENDHATGIFLQWFVSEQVEEEESASDIIDQLHLAGEQGPGVLMVDKELAARVFVPPTEAGSI